MTGGAEWDHLDFSDQQGPGAGVSQLGQKQHASGAWAWAAAEASEDAESGSGPNEMQTHKHSGSQAEPTRMVSGLKGFLGGCRDVGPTLRAGWCPHTCWKAKGTRSLSGFSGETGKRWHRQG